MEKTYKLPAYSLTVLILSTAIQAAAYIFAFAVGCMNFGNPECSTANQSILWLTGGFFLFVVYPAGIIATVTMLVSFIWRKKKGLYISKLHRITSLIITIILILIGVFFISRLF